MISRRRLLHCAVADERELTLPVKDRLVRALQFACRGGRVEYLGRYGCFVGWLSRTLGTSRTRWVETPKSLWSSLALRPRAKRAGRVHGLRGLQKAMGRGEIPRLTKWPGHQGHPAERNQKDCIGCSLDAMHGP
jgi:hypothetical protein